MSSIGRSLLLTGTRQRRSTSFGVTGSVAVVAVMLTVLIGAELGHFHGHVAGLINFGQRTAAITHRPAGTPTVSTDGYDGQIYWIQANDPLLIHRATIDALHRGWPGYFLQRPAYPALAYLLSAGQRDAIPWALLIINLICVLALTAAVSRYAIRQGHSAWWGLAIGLMPGLFMPLLRDLSDVLAITTMLGGLIAWRTSRRWLTAALLAIAVLSREPMTLAVVAVAVDGAVGWWSQRCRPGSGRAALRAVWPAVVIPAAAFVGWQAYLHIRVSAVPGGAMQATGTPVSSLMGYLGELHAIFSRPLWPIGVWELGYIALMVAGSLVALALLRRGPRAPTVAALLFAGTLMIILFGDWWGETRYSAPMFGALLLAGLELRSRTALGVCTAVASMGTVAPLFIPGL